jgi:hypothetical protein
MRRGAVAFMDALGFKGIWRRHRHDAVLDKLRCLRTAAELAKDEAVKERRIVIAETNRSLATFSDTIFFACSATSLPEAQTEVGVAGGQFAETTEVEFAGLAVTSAVLAHVIAEATHAPVPLAFRGAIAFGEYSAEEEFVIGPAVDEAAAAHEAADAAVVWFCPSAMAVLDGFRPPPTPIQKLQDLERKYIARDCDVPLKQGRRFRTAVVQPFAAVESTKIESCIERTLSTFQSNDVDVAVKKQNTRVFLQWARSAKTI